MKRLLNDYFKVNIAFLPVLLFIRAYELFIFYSQHSVPAGIWRIELQGYLLDNLVFLSFSLVVFVLFALLWKIQRKPALILGFVMFFLYMALAYSLSVYFTITTVPLDQVLFFYTRHEIIQIVLSTLRFELTGFLVLLALIAIPFGIYYLLKNFRFSWAVIIPISALFLASPLIVYLLTPSQAGYRDDFSYYVISNKPEYALVKLWKYKTGMNTGGRTASDRIQDVKLFHSLEPDFAYLDNDHPLLRVDKTPDALGRYFDFGKEKPNIVFLIIESLSPSFCSERPFYGSFTPFLDSLRGKSLYWQNCYSTSERTFNVLSGVFASAPYSNGIFFENGDRMPRYFSLIRYLKESGYYTSFMYGGDPTFSSYSKFVKHQGIDYLLNFYGNKYNKNDQARDNLWVWGFPDGDMFQRSLDVIDSMNRKPRLDIYLTLSMHLPFSPPQQEVYLKRLQQRVKELGLNSIQQEMVIKQRKIFSTILYTDNCLRQFFKRYSKRPDFKNTIFIITGDHSMPEIYATNRSPIEKYHVPLIIYSPMLNQAAQFQSVSTHLDITPSLLAMLKNRFGIQLRPVCHWLGKGLDVSSSYGSRSYISFIFNNRSQGEFLHGNDFISNRRLFRLLPGSKLLPVENAAVMNRLEQEQKAYLRVTDSIIKPNSVVPDELYFNGNYQVIPYTSGKPFKYHNFRDNESFISLMPRHDIKRELLFLRIRLSLKIKPENGDTSSIPKVTVEVADPKVPDNFLYYAYKLKPSRKGEKDTYELDAFSDLSSLPQLSRTKLNIYFWNLKNQWFILDDLKMNCEAYTLY